LEQAVDFTVLASQEFSPLQDIFFDNPALVGKTMAVPLLSQHCLHSFSSEKEKWRHEKEKIS
jgi:hypothetical protein